MKMQDEGERCWRSACNGVLAEVVVCSLSDVCPVCGEPRNAGIHPKDLKASPNGVFDEIFKFDQNHWVARKGKTLTRHEDDDLIDVREYATVEKAKEDLRCDVLSWRKNSHCELCGQEI